jgi:drug/metabolite transporter (DMT)-like permease
MQGRAAPWTAARFAEAEAAHRPHIPLVASLVALSAGVVWSFGAIAARLADHTDAFQYLIWRSIGILLVVEVVALVRGRPFVTRRAFTSGGMMLLAAACLLLASIAFVYAVKTTTPANAAFLASVTPLIAVLLAKVALGEALTRVTIAAVAVAFVGLLVMVVGDLQAGNLVGNVSALLSSVGFAGYAVCLRTDARRDWSAAIPGYAVMMIVLCAVITFFRGETFVPPAGDIGYALVHGGVFIVLGTTLFNIASRQIPAVPMAVFSQTEMLFVPVWAYLVLSERPTVPTMIGGAIIFSAVLGKALLDARAPAVQIAQPAESR